MLMLVINPKRLENEYTFKDLAGVGVAFIMLLLLYIHDHYGIKDERYDFIDLVAIDSGRCYALLEENRIIVNMDLKD